MSAGTAGCGVGEVRAAGGGANPNEGGGRGLFSGTSRHRGEVGAPCQRAGGPAGPCQGASRLWSLILACPRCVVAVCRVRRYLLSALVRPRQPLLAARIEARLLAPSLPPPVSLSPPLSLYLPACLCLPPPNKPLANGWHFQALGEMGMEGGTARRGRVKREGGSEGGGK